MTINLSGDAAIVNPHKLLLRFNYNNGQMENKGIGSSDSGCTGTEDGMPKRGNGSYGDNNGLNILIINSCVHEMK